MNGYTLATDEPRFRPPERPAWARGGAGRYQVLQFSGPVRPEWKSALRALGVRLFDYVPESGFVARIPGAQRGAVRNLSFISYLGPFEPAFRVERGLEGRPGERETVNVVLFDGESVDEVAARVEALGGRVLKRSAVDLQVRLPRTGLAGLAALEGVRWVEAAKHLSFENAQNSWRVQSGVPDYRPLWERGLLGEGQIVGVADSGLDWDHECFHDPARPQVRLTPPGTSQPPDLAHRKIVNYWLFTGDAEDTEGHGTHVSGTVACDNDIPGGTGDPNGQGIAPRARLSFTDLEGAFFPVPLVSDVPRLLANQYADGARLHNDSWGEFTHFRDYGALSRAFDEYLWDHKDFLALIANGNSGAVQVPATAKNVVSVGFGAFSLGPTSDGRIKPTLVAQGTLTSSQSDRSQGAVNFEYESRTGTSMATPSVAGGLALVRQYFMEGFHPGGQATPAQAFTPSAALLKAVLLAGTVEVTSGAFDQRGEGVFPNNTQGWGFVNLDGSLHFAGERRQLWLVDRSPGLDTGAEATFTVSVVDPTEPLRVVLVWTDYPGSFGSPAGTPALVNDLDLRVTAPDGTLYLGNVRQGLNPGRSVSGGAPDRVNVEEGVLLPSAQYGLLAGTYTLTVQAVNVPQGPQPFALVVTGGLEGGAIDTEAPAVVSTSPVAGAAEVASTTPVSLTFSEPMARSTVTSAFSIQPGVAGSFSWSGATLTFSPASGLVERTLYTVTVSTAAKDLAGNPLSAPFTFSFSTVGYVAPPAPQPPHPPGMATGPAVCFSETTYPYFSWTTDANGDRIQYVVDLGDGSTTTVPALPSGTRATASHAWGRAGSFALRVQAIDETGRASPWSPPLAVTVTDAPAALATASSGDGAVTLSAAGTESQHAQSFRTSVSVLRVASLALARTTDADFPILVSVRSSLAGADLAYAILNPGDVGATDPTATNWVRVTLSRNVSLSAGGTYYVVVRRNGFGAGSYSWGTNSANPYSNGQLYEGPSAMPRPGVDALMRIPSSAPPPNVPPSVPGTVDGPATGAVGASVAFEALAHDANGDAVRLVFDWGDGALSTTDPAPSATPVSASHAWTTSGVFAVRARAVDANDLASAWGGVTSVTIGGGDTTPPSAAFTAGPASGPAPLLVQLMDQSTGSITSWAWNFGDGTTSTERNPAHSYAQAADYSVSLTVSGPGGSSSLTRPALVHVEAGIPPQRLTVRITSPPADGLVLGGTFYNNASIAYLGLYNGNEAHGTFAFGGVSIPRGARIVSARLRVPAAEGVVGACALRLVGFAQDGAPPVTSFGDWQSRPRTSASVPWIPEGWQRGQVYTSPELAPVVQEIVDRPGWAPGSGLALSLGGAPGNTGYAVIFERDQGTSYGAELVIDYLP